MNLKGNFELNLSTVNFMGSIALYSWGNGSFIMIFVFGLVIISLIAAVYFMMNSDKKK